MMTGFSLSPLNLGVLALSILTVMAVGSAVSRRSGGCGALNLFSQLKFARMNSFHFAVQALSL
jgi:hypothetical protein